MLNEVKTSELLGAPLDWAVSKGEKLEYDENLRFSSDWAIGGPLIERWEIDLKKEGLRTWRAKTVSIGRLYTATGPTPLVAAMRCYVEGKLGDSVFVPLDVLKGN